MKVVEVNVGKKIEYSVSKNKITFADVASIISFTPENVTVL